MRPEEIKKLLGGYATGTLTAEEQQALFAAALEDQELFDALAREQTLRDVLADPATRGELLAALDRRSTAFDNFWQWLRRPMVAGLVTAAVSCIAIVAVWRGTRPAAPERTLVAEMKQQELRPAAPGMAAPAQEPAPAQAQAQAKLQNGPVAAQSKPAPTKRAASPGGQDFSKLIAPAPVPLGAPPAAPPPRAASAELRDEKDAAPLMEKKKEQAAAAAESGAVGGGVGGGIGAVGGAPDARAIFYSNQPASAANAFVQPAAPPAARGGSGGGGAAGPPSAVRQRPTPQTLGPAQMSLAAAPTPLGVRASILRADGEVDPGTVLKAGESVRLKIVANADGFVRVTEGTRTIVSAAVQSYQPFETPALTLEGASPRQLAIAFSRTPLSNEVALDTAGRANLVEPRADQGRATYVVSASQSVVIPVTLTFR